MKILSTREAMFVTSLNELSFWLLHEDMAAGRTSSWDSIVQASQFGGRSHPSTDPWITETIHRSQLLAPMTAARLAYGALPEDERLVISLLHHDSPGRVPVELRVACDWRPDPAVMQSLDLSLVACMVAKQTPEVLSRWCKNTPKRFRPALEEAKALARKALEAFTEAYINVQDSLPKSRKFRWVGDKTK